MLSSEATCGAGSGAAPRKTANISMTPAAAAAMRRQSVKSQDSRLCPPATARSRAAAARPAGAGASEAASMASARSRPASSRRQSGQDPAWARAAASSAGGSSP